MTWLETVFALSIAGNLVAAYRIAMQRLDVIHLRNLLKIERDYSEKLARQLREGIEIMKRQHQQRWTDRRYWS